MIKKIVIPLGFILSVMFSSCRDTPHDNNELTREYACQLIMDFYDYPNVETVKICTFTCLRDRDHPEFLIDEGYLNTELKSSPRDPNPCYELSVGEVGQGFYHRKSIEKLNRKTWFHFAANIREFDSVTGLSLNEGGTSANVEFEINRTQMNDIAMFFGLQSTAQLSVVMNKYDDGWRIIDESSMNLKKEKFDGLK